MNTRQASIEAYRNLVEGGVLAEKNSVVYSHLFYNGQALPKAVHSTAFGNAGLGGVVLFQ
jgi:hypothetical protein